VDTIQVTISALDYQQPSWDTGNVSVLQKKVGILLGFRDLKTRSLTDLFANKDLKLVPDKQFESPDGDFRDLEIVGPEEIKERFSSFQELPLIEFVGEDPRKLFEEIAFLSDGLLSESALRNGIYMDRYRIGSVVGGNGFQLLFKPDEREQWWNLASYSTRENAVGAANDLRRLFIKLNIESEGIHIIEHILLRPLCSDAHEDIPCGFYSFKISVVFPAWTARFNDEGFRRLAEETVQLNCPAHIYPEFHWLEFGKMREFEDLYKKWLNVRSDSDSNHQEIDATAKPLIRFLLKI
jgi:hypothetical protein